MNHLRKLGLGAMVLLATMAVWGVGSASATELYKYTTPSPNDTLGVGTELRLTLAPTAGNLLIEDTWGSPFVISTCTETELAGKTESPGGETTHPLGALSTVKFSTCTDTMTIETKGKFEVRHIAGTTNGTLYVSGLKFNFKDTFLNFQCAAVVNGYFGTLKGATSATGYASVEVLANVERPVCGPARIKADFTVAAPTGLIVEAK
ncbi:MAG TPA: hypothetical protein VF125_12865 [Solirubrobacterales bacterium]